MKKLLILLATTVTLLIALLPSGLSYAQTNERDRRIQTKIDEMWHNDPLSVNNMRPETRKKIEDQVDRELAVDAELDRRDDPSGQSKPRTDPQEIPDQGPCSISIWGAISGSGTGGWITCQIARIGDFVLRMSALVLWMAGWAFNTSVTYSLNMVKILNDLPIVNTGWVIIRDITNLFYIFLLLFIAINIIIGNSTYGKKELISQIIITALLINFSLFATKLVIDASNIVSLQFYNAMISASPNGTSGNRDVGISDQFMNQLNLQSIYKTTNSTNVVDRSGQNPGVLDQFLKIAMVTFLGSIFILATAVVFFAGSFMFIARSMILMIVMMTSAGAIAARLLPATKDLYTKWYKKLIDQALFAPVFVGMIYILISAMNTVNKTGTNRNIDFSAMILKGEFGSGFITFAMILGSLIAILLVASKLGGVGASSFHSFVDGWVGLDSWKKRGMSIGSGIKSRAGTIASRTAARTVGGGLTAAANSRAAKWLGRAPLVGGYISRKFAKAGDVKFGDVSRNDIIKSDKEKAEAQYKYQTTFDKKQKLGESDADYKTRMKAEKDKATARGNKFLKTDPTGAITPESRSIFDTRGYRDFQTSQGKTNITEAKAKERLSKDITSHAFAVERILGSHRLDANGGQNNGQNDNLKLFKPRPANNSAITNVLTDADVNAEVLADISEELTRNGDEIYDADIVQDRNGTWIVNLGRNFTLRESAPSRGGPFSSPEGNNFGSSLVEKARLYMTAAPADKDKAKQKLDAEAKKLRSQLKSLLEKIKERDTPKT